MKKSNNSSEKKAVNLKATDKSGDNKLHEDIIDWNLISYNTDTYAVRT